MAVAASLFLSILLCFSLADAFNGFASTTATPSPQPPPPPEVHEHSTFFSYAALIAPILSHLGFNELATAAPSLYSDNVAAAWSGPFTVFAPSDSSLRTCTSCSDPNLLREHIAPGIFNIDYLRTLAFGTKIETLSSGRCLTITYSAKKNVTASGISSSATASKVYVGGVEITHPDLFNNGIVVVHGLQGYIAPLSPLSCDVETLNSLTFPHEPQDRVSSHSHQLLNQQQLMQPAIMKLMLRDAMLRLRNNGFGILSLAMKLNYAKLVTLSNFTVFALDDISIFSGSHTYISSIRFHILPNQFLTDSDLEKLPVGSTLPTLEKGQSLVVTTAGSGGKMEEITTMRINYVRIKVPEVIKNLKIVIHCVYLPFPSIHPTTSVYDGLFGGRRSVGLKVDGASSCSAISMDENCGMTPTPSVDIDDDYGLWGINSLL